VLDAFDDADIDSAVPVWLRVGVEGRR